jgi:hypothetical protein
MRVILRILGCTGLIAGSLDAFVQIVSLLFKKNRNHLALMRLVNNFFFKMRVILGTIGAWRFAIAGRFRGAMRTQKRICQFGSRLKIQLLTKRLDAVSTCVHTRWGVFGLKFFLQFRYPSRVDYYTSITPATQCLDYD